MYEALALDKMFRGERALISSTKSMTGHECWMAGASEIVYSIIMMHNNFIAPNINFNNPGRPRLVSLKDVDAPYHGSNNNLSSSIFNFSL